MKKTSILKNKTLIIGCGRLGASIANADSLSGKNVLVVDKDSSSFELLSDLFSGYTFLGDVTDLSLLEEAYITSAKEIIIATGDDNVNLFLAYVARKLYNVPKIYVRLDDPSLEILISDLDVKAIYPFELSLDKFQMYKWLTGHNYRCAKSYINKEQFYQDIENDLISFPVFVKPEKGSASIAISKVIDKETIEMIARTV